MLRKVVSTRLKHHGWTELPGPAVAWKSFMTAVGEREAHVYLAKWPEAHKLDGVYYSEGRNILESCSVILPLGPADETVIELVDRFVRESEAMIADSYAARLLHFVAAPAA